MTRQTAREVDDEAAVWALKADAIDDPALAAWLDGDPRRQGALLRAQAALSFVDRARALETSPAPAGRARPSRRSVVILAGGAGALVAAGLGAVAVLGAGQRYVTGVGEIRRQPLADGSLAEINTDSVIEVALRRRVREVVVHRGEAWFQVAKDPDRPFVVRAGDAQARAVGTAFSVRRRTGSVELLITEGVVEASIEGGGKTLAQAGSQLIIAAGRPLEPVNAELQIERALAWRHGQISLDGETLAEAAAEFNRYNRRPLIIEDRDLARRQFVGLFRTDDPQSFALAVAAASGARLVEDDRAIRLR
jgi:transmembrane sensor